MNPNISSFPELHFLDAGSSATVTELDWLEKRIERQLPESLRVWLELHSGSMLDRVNYFLPMQNKPCLPCSIGVEYMLSADEIEQALDQFGDSFPVDHVPFGDDGDGNYLLIAQDGAVCFWDWRGRINISSAGAVDNHTTRIAESLPNFLAELGAGPLTENEYSSKRTLKRERSM